MFVSYRHIIDGSYVFKRMGLNRSLKRSYIDLFRNVYALWFKNPPHVVQIFNLVK